MSKSCTESDIKSITNNWNIAMYCIYEWMKCYQEWKIIDEWFVLLKDIILHKKKSISK
jgi:hypothetical protein